MKYSSGIRLINVVLFALLLAGFGFLGIWFGFLVTPYLWIGKGSPVSLPDMSYGLAALLGCFGLTGAFLSLKGLFHSIKGMTHEHDDLPVKKAFGCYIGVGYLLAIFCLFNGLWLYRLTSTNLSSNVDMAFVIVVFMILLIVIVFLTNLPMIRLFGEDSDFNKTMEILTSVVGLANLSVAIVFGASYFATKCSADRFYGQDMIATELGLPALLGLIAFLLCLVAFLGYRKADKNKTVKKLNGVLFEGGLFLSGLSIIITSILEHVNQSATRPMAVSLVAKSVNMTNVNYLDFAIMGYILGGLICLASLAFLKSTLFPKKTIVSQL